MAGEPTHWDRDFEDEFDAADTHFPAVLSWLEQLERHDLPDHEMREAFVAQPADDHQLQMLTECVVSLAVRSPMNREASVALAESLRGRLPKRERESLIGANMHRSQRLIADTIGARAKFAVLFSPGREFIFGDGFYHNVTAVVNPPQFPEILAPLTPQIAVAITRPMSYMVNPRLSTLVLTEAEVDTCNYAVQVHAGRSLFFRSELPPIEDAFVGGQHLRFAHETNSIRELFDSIPGVHQRRNRVTISRP